MSVCVILCLSMTPNVVPAPCQNTLYNSPTTSGHTDTSIHIWFVLKVFTAMTICVRTLTHTYSHTNLDWLEGQGHFPLAASLTLCFPGQPFSSTRLLIGNLDRNWAQHRQKDFSFSPPQTLQNIFPCPLFILSLFIPLFFYPAQQH